MPACHAGGHEFESRTHRKVHWLFRWAFFGSVRKACWATKSRHCKDSGFHFAPNGLVYPFAASWMMWQIKICIFSVWFYYFLAQNSYICGQKISNMKQNEESSFYVYSYKQKMDDWMPTFFWRQGTFYCMVADDCGGSAEERHRG